MKKDYTHIAVVLDRSGSMASCANDTIVGFNAFVEEQKKAAGTATFTLAQFDAHYEIVHDAIGIKDVPPLVFVPRRGTALLDAIGRTLTITSEWLNAKPENERPEHVVFVILTDGEENASKEFTRSTIMEMIQRQQRDHKWQFVFLAANQDAIQSGKRMGIHRDSSMTYDVHKSGRAYGTMSEKVSDVRSGAHPRIGFTKEDRDRNKPE